MGRLLNAKSKKNHAILGIKLKLSPEVIKRDMRDFVGLENYEYTRAGDEIYWCGRYDFDVGRALDLSCLAHLGFDADNLRRYVVGAVEAWHHYFCVYWKEFFRQNKKLLDQGLASELPWYIIFSEGLLLAAVSSKQCEAVDVCNWLKSDLEPEYHGDDTDPSIPTMYKAIAELIREKPMRGLKPELMRTRSEGSERANALLDLVDAINARNSEEFSQRLPMALRTFKLKKRDVMPRACVAQEESILCWVAALRKLSSVNLSPELSALIATGRSCGLEASK